MNTTTTDRGFSLSSITGQLPPAERAILAALMGWPDAKSEVLSPKS
jgi:hypothetical protein